MNKFKMGPTLSHDLAVVLVYIAGLIIKTYLPYSDRAMNMLTDEAVYRDFKGAVR